MMQKELVLEAIILFDKTAKELIKSLAEKYNLDLNSATPFSKLLLRSNSLWRGNLNEEWTYWFHGAHCDFENINSKQYVHTNIIRGIYGVIDYYYLYKFVQTTESLKHVLEIVNEEDIFYATINKLLDDGMLINLEEFPFKMLVLNDKPV